MHTYGGAFYELKNELSSLYDDREAAAVTHELLNHITGMSKMDRLMNKDYTFTDEQEVAFIEGKKQLRAGRPLQYVTGTAWFMEREYEVNEYVLIPRPETEELIQWVLQETPGNTEIRILDIGTGSGIIPIELKLALPMAHVTSADISEGALEVAARNADTHFADIQLIGLDILDREQQNNMGIYDVIVSNPPYIPISGKATMHSNVKDHEPSLALFVPDDDALLFYREIAQFGKTHLAPKGRVYCELEQSHAHETKALFELMGYGEVEIRKDMHDNWRMLKAVVAQ